MKKPASIMVSVLLLISIPSVMSIIPIARTSAATETSPVMRVGLDLSWYVTNGFGSLHGVNCNANAAACYEYLTHGWKDSGGLSDGICPSGDSCSGGFFTAYEYDIENPPLYPPGYISPYGISNSEWILQFIAAANADHDGTQAKIFIGFILENNFDATLYGAFNDFLNKLGPVQDNPAVAGFEFRGAQEGINTGGGASSWGCEESRFVPSNVVYGLSGMDSFPQNSSQEARMWSEAETKVNSYGYTLGISTGLSDMDTCVSPRDYSDNLAQFFIQGVTIHPSVTASPSASYTDNLKTFYDAVANPPRAPAVSVGTVFGEWDPHWFVPNYPQSGYHATRHGIQSSLQGFAEGAAINPTAGQYWFIYGMPYLTNDDASGIAKHGPCPFLPWILRYATEYGFFTDFSAPLKPSTITPVTPPSPPYTLAPTGLYIHIIGDSFLDGLKPSYSQTDPVHCCGTDKYYINGQLIRLSDGEGVANEQIHIYEFNYTTDKWNPVMLNGAPLVVTTDSNGYYGGEGSVGTIVVPSPPLPNTGRNQAYFYPAFLGDSTYGPSNGVLEDLPILAAGATQTTTTSTVTCSKSTVVVGSAVTCKETVHGSGTKAPTGKVTWSSSGSGTFVKTSCRLSRHKAYSTCSVRFTPTAPDSSVLLTANYGGDLKNSPSAGTYSLGVTKKATTTTVSCSPKAVVAGSSKKITCKALVKGYLPTGTVSWSQSGTGAVTLSSTTCTLKRYGPSLTTGTCSVKMTGTTAGTVTLQATYSGDPNNQGSLHAAMLTIKKP